MRFTYCIAALMVVSGASMVRAAEPAASAVFEQLKTLVGDWHTTQAGKATTVNYKLIANGTVLVETWTMSPTRQSMTVYNMDKNRLVATHYCPQGNAPRLVLIGSDEQGAHRFEFLDGANLQDPEGFHEHAFWIRLDPSGTISRSETYIGNRENYDRSKPAGTVDSFSRDGAKKPEPKE